MRNLTFFLAAALAGSLAAASAQAQGAPDKAGDSPSGVPRQLKDPTAADVTITSHVLEPVQLEPTRERISHLHVPEGFEVSVFADNLINPRMIAVADDGTVYVTRRAVGDVVMLRDSDGDGKADGEPKVVASRPQMHGIAIDGDTVFLITVADIYKADRAGDGTLKNLTRIVGDLPGGGQHPNRMIQIGPDGALYVSVGSTCNACAETDPENATILRVERDGSSRSIFASGLRNTIGFAFEPETGEIYGMDHGIDWLGDDEQSEELNHIEKGKKYGWPYIYADGQKNPQDEPPNGLTFDEWAAESTGPVMLYTPHAAPMQLAFYESETNTGFPDEYKGDAFIAMRGSWNRKPPSGYEVLRIHFEDGKPVAFEPFVTGFLMRDGDRWGQMGRLAGLAVAGDGALLVSDDKNGVIYRIAFTGNRARADRGQQAEAAGNSVLPAVKNEPQRTAGLARDSLGSSNWMEVSSPSFENGGAIPGMYAAEQQNASPPISWKPTAKGIGSFVVLMEDPDAPVPDPPFVHWVLYNVPPDVRSLETGVPGTPKLAKPKDALQGTNDSGSTGYFGMRPPEGDPAHRYFLQVFALDSMLDLPHGSSRETVLAAMKGHVLEAGAVTGSYKR